MASRGNARAKTEILDMLKADHQSAKKAFRAADKAIEQEDQETLQQVVQQACLELSVHAQIEEELFYPALRQGIKEVDLLEEAEVEHMSAKALISQLQSMSADDPKYAATFTVLGEYVKHHIREEETEMFEQLNRTRIDWEPLLQEMQQRRAQLMAEQGLPGEEEGEEGEEDEVQALASAPSSPRGGSSRRGGVRTGSAGAAK
jgi:hemerythrin superfamily protein